MISQRLNICFFFLSKYVWFACGSMTHNDFDHLAQLLPKEKSPCAVDASRLHALLIWPGFVFTIFILQRFFSTPLPVYSYATATLQGYNTLEAKSIQKHLFQQAIPDGVFPESLKAIAICKYFMDMGHLFVVSSLVHY